jgi:hypothetical protein
VLFEHGYAHAGAREKKTEHHARRTAADDATFSGNVFSHGNPFAAPISARQWSRGTVIDGIIPLNYVYIQPAAFIAAFAFFAIRRAADRRTESGATRK